MTGSSVVIFGYDELMLDSIEYFQSSVSTISAVVFPSSRRDQRAKRVRGEVEKKGLRTLEQPARVGSSTFIDELEALKPDFLFVWSYPMILPPAVLNIPGKHSVNLHFGMLPEYRGVNGLRWALMNGEKRTGVTLHYIDDGIDTGDMIATAAFAIDDDDNIRSLMRKGRQAGLALLERCWPAIAAGDVDGTPQDEDRAGYYSAAMSPERHLDWSGSSDDIHNLVRASVDPMPGVHSFAGDVEMRIVETDLIESDGHRHEPGKVLTVDEDGITVTTAGGLLLVTEVEVEGVTIPQNELVSLGVEPGTVLSDRDPRTFIEAHGEDVL